IPNAASQPSTGVTFDAHPAHASASTASAQKRASACILLGVTELEFELARSVVRNLRLAVHDRRIEMPLLDRIERGSVEPTGWRRVDDVRVHDVAVEVDVVRDDDIALNVICLRIFGIVRAFPGNEAQTLIVRRAAAREHEREAGERDPL